MPITRADNSLGNVDELLALAKHDGADAGNIIDSSATGSDFVLIFRNKQDGRVRPEHAALEGRVWELDDPDAPSPPLAPGCRCFVEIIAREKAAARENTTPAESLKSFKDLENNLEKVYPLDVVEGYANGKLKPDDLIIKRTGDRLTTDQARAVIASREAGKDPKAALKAVAELADKGLSGRTLAPIIQDARERIAKGESPREAARAAITATTRRGYVTASTADGAADSLVRSRLMDGEGPKPRPRPTTETKPKPPPVAPKPKVAIPGSREDAQSAIDALAKVREETAAAKARAQATSDQMAEMTAHLDARTRAAELVMIPKEERTTADIKIPPSRQTASIKSGATTFRSLVSEKALPSSRTATVVASKARRESASPTTGKVMLNSQSASQVTVHELGHLLEADPDMRRAAKAFLDRRTAGETSERLRDITGNKGYHRSEITKKDGFFSPYVGKQYDSGYTEVISMGLEKMAEDPAEFARLDPDHFRFIYQLCRGTLDP
jgi:hypothetical protein